MSDWMKIGMEMSHTTSMTIFKYQKIDINKKHSLDKNIENN